MEDDRYSGYFVQYENGIWLGIADGHRIDDGSLEVMKDRKVIAYFCKNNWTSFFYAKNKEEYLFLHAKFFPKKIQDEPICKKSSWKFWKKG